MTAFIITDADNIIVYQHNFPFDEQMGLGKTEQELLQKGHLVDTVPDAPRQDGKFARVKYINGQFEFIYKNEIVPVNETQQRIEQLETDLGASLFESAMDKAKIAELETTQGEMLMEIATLKTGGV